MVNKRSRAAFGFHPADTNSESISSQRLGRLQAFSFSASDTEYAAMIARNLLTATKTNNFFLLESCAETLMAFYEKLVQERGGQ